MWNAPLSASTDLQPADLSRLPEIARKYLSHAIASGTRPARAVRLRMHGRIKLNRWFPFNAEQVIVWGRGMIWKAAVRMLGLPVRGSDRLLDGKGAMSWRLCGLIPVMSASGEDITRSAAGRMAGETVWLPSVLASNQTSWRAADSNRVLATVSVAGLATELRLTVDGEGRLESLRFSRWGDPDGTGFHSAEFGGVVEEENTFDGFTIPTRLRIGWHHGSSRFEQEGEFFRVAIDHAEYR